MKPGEIADVSHGNLVVRFTANPPTFSIETRAGVVVQRLVLSATDPTMTFKMPSGPLLGLGEGGPQFDKRAIDRPDAQRPGASRADGYRLAVNGTRAPVQWLVGTGDGWAMFIHQPYGALRFHGRGRPVHPAAAAARAADVRRLVDRDREPFLPLDVFVVASTIRVIMREYARITGFAEMPRALDARLSAVASHARRAARRSSASRARCARRSCRATR